MTQKTNPWTFDVRVRNRNLKAGTITDKDVEKYLVGLPDLADKSEAFGTSQPALLPPPEAEVADLDEDDEDEDEDEGVEDDGGDEGEVHAENESAGTDHLPE